MLLVINLNSMFMLDVMETQQYSDVAYSPLLLR